LVGIDMPFEGWVCPEGDIYKLARKKFKAKWHKR